MHRILRFPEALPRGCRSTFEEVDLGQSHRLSHAQHSGAQPRPSSMAFQPTRLPNGSVSLKTSRGFFLAVERRTRSVVLRRKKPGAEGLFEVLQRRNCSVSLRTSGGHFVNALGGGMFAAGSSEAGEQESFDTVLRPDGTVALRGFDGSYLDAEQLDARDHRLRVLGGSKRTPNALFTVINHRDGPLSLLSRYGRYLSADANGTVTAGSTAINKSERFRSEKVSAHPPLLALKSAFGRYVEINKTTGRVVAVHKKAGPCARFKTSNVDDRLSLESCGHHLTVDRVPIYTFYGYRAMSQDDFKMRNVNIGNLAGVLWYLHNEVVVNQPRKFDISRIVRARFRMTPPDELLSAGMHFGVRFAYDTGVCTGAGKEEWQGEGSCDPFYEKFGYFVGCNNLNSYPFPMPSQGFPVHYPGARWYSFPGESFCGEGDIAPTGEKNCLYTYEHAGSIDISELAGIGDYGGFVGGGGREYVFDYDSGVHNGFWNKKFDNKSCARRLKSARKMFRKKYPDSLQDLDLPEPECDFDCYRFYDGDPYDPPDDCNATLQREIAARINPRSAPQWTWGTAMNV